MAACDIADDGGADVGLAFTPSAKVRPVRCRMVEDSLTVLELEDGRADLKGRVTEVVVGKKSRMARLATTQSCETREWYDDECALSVLGTRSCSEIMKDAGNRVLLLRSSETGFGKCVSRRGGNEVKRKMMQFELCNSPDEK